MTELSIKYNKTKIIKYLGASIVLIIIFGLITFNVEYLAHQKPTSTLRYSWVKKLFYKRENLLLGFTLFCNLIFLLVILDSILMLIRGKLVLQVENGIIYKNGKYLVEQKDILKTELFNTNKSSFILIYLRSLENVKNKRSTFLDKLVIRAFLLINRNRLQIRLSFLESDKQNYKRISAFLKK